MSKTIRQKLNGITLRTCLTAVALAGMALLVHEIVSYRGKVVAELSAQARILGRLTRAAVSFEDRTEAEHTLAELKEQRHIECAILFSGGRPFAEYHRHDEHDVDIHDTTLETAEPMADAEYHSASHVTVVRRLEYDGTPLGAILIRSDLSEIKGYALRHGIILLGVFAIATVIALILGARLHRSILLPIQTLTRTARAIAQDNDFSQRAERISEDETGELTIAFNRMLDRIHEQAQALQDSEARYRFLFRNSPLPAWLFDAETFRFLEVNEAALRTYGYSESEFLALTVPQVCTDSARALASQCASPPAPMPFEPIRGCLRQHQRKDGSRIEVEVCADPIEYRQRQAWLVVAQDVTARRKSEADLAAANAKLVETSRQAGMAEVATGVLHNVGNVLNSVNVSATLIRDRLGSSRITAMRRTTDLLKPHLQSLDRFLTQDPQGRVVVPYLIQLGDHLADEQKQLMAEANSLAVNIEHIKEIVSMQQGFARVSGIREPIEPAALFEDVIRMSTGSLEKRDIVVVREFTPTPQVLADRHTVLQILMNLVTNARHALDHGSEEPRRLTLRTGIASPTHAYLEVADNGMGIAADSLTRIFSLGFTTKRDGHGFGLHSGANAARELGGRLSVASEGTGRGATFRLELPLADPPGTAA